MNRKQTSNKENQNMALLKNQSMDQRLIRLIKHKQRIQTLLVSGMKEHIYLQQCLQKENKMEINEIIHIVMRKIGSLFFFFLKKIEMVMMSFVVKKNWFREGLMLEHIQR